MIIFSIHERHLYGKYQHNNIYDYEDYNVTQFYDISILVRKNHQHGDPDKKSTKTAFFNHSFFSLQTPDFF